MTNDSNQWKSLPRKFPHLINVTAVGLLAGLSFAVQFAVLPVLNQLDAAHYIDTMHAVTPTFMRAVVPLMFMGLGTFLVRLLWLRSPCRGMQYWTLAAFAFFLVGGWVTIRGHWPLNNQLSHWQAQNPPGDWQLLRQRWGQLNFWRFAAAQLAFLALLVPFVFGRGRHTQSQSSDLSVPISQAAGEFRQASALGRQAI